MEFSDEEQPKGKTVLIGVNGSNHSTNAFQWYVTNALLDTDELVLVFCTETSPPETSDDIVSKAEEKVQQVLASIEETAKSYNVKYRVERVQGSPGEAIVQASKDFGATVVVVGSRGHSKLRRAIIGSISDHIAKHSLVPVIICKYDESTNSKTETMPLPAGNDIASELKVQDVHL